MQHNSLVRESAKHFSIFILGKETAFPWVGQNCGIISPWTVAASSIEEDIGALPVIGEVADHKSGGVDCPKLALYIVVVLYKVSKLYSFNLIRDVDDPGLLGSFRQRTEFRVLLLHKPGHSLNIRHLQGGLVTDSQVAAGVCGVRQGVAILADARGGGRTASQADQVAPAHALALLLTAVKETLLLLVSGTLEHASVKRETGLQDVRVIRGRRANHRLAAGILGIWLEFALGVDILCDQFAARLASNLQFWAAGAGELTAVEPGLSRAVARVLSPAGWRIADGAGTVLGGSKCTSLLTVRVTSVSLLADADCFGLPSVASYLVPALRSRSTLCVLARR
jgi:hypothetical protein